MEVSGKKLFETNLTYQEFSNIKTEFENKSGYLLPICAMIHLGGHSYNLAEMVYYIEVGKGTVWSSLDKKELLNKKLKKIKQKL